MQLNDFFNQTLTGIFFKTSLKSRSDQMLLRINEPFSFAPEARLLRDAQKGYLLVGGFLFTKTDKNVYFICVSKNRQQPASDHNRNEREGKGAALLVVASSRIERH